MPIAVHKKLRLLKKKDLAFCWMHKDWIGYAVKVIIRPDVEKLGLQVKDTYSVKESDLILKNMKVERTYVRSHGFEKAVIYLPKEYVGKQVYIVAEFAIDYERELWKALREVAEQVHDKGHATIRKNSLLYKLVKKKK